MQKKYTSSSRISLSPHKIFLRKRIFRLLDNSRDNPIVWVCGPAGSGKTTLLNSYIKDRDLPSLWYQLESNDRDIESFFYNLSLAAAKSHQRKQFPLLTTENLLDIKSYTRQFFQDLYSRLKAPSVIVFDNLQEVLHARNFHQLLCDGLSVIPEGITVVLIGRNTFPQTLLSLRSNVAFVGWDKLRLTHVESKEIIRFLGHQDFSDEMICQIYESTEGWMVGLRLMLEMERQKRPFPISIADSIPEEIIDYFNTNISQRIDNQTLDFLLKTAWLPQFTDAMAENLSGCSQINRILDYLSHNHLFLERKRVSTKTFYRYPFLFRNFLLHHASEIFPMSTLSSIQNSATKLMEEHGLTSDGDEIFYSLLDWKGDLRFSSNPKTSITNRYWPLKIHTLGRFELVRYNKPIELSRKAPKKLFTMLKALIVLGGKDVSETQISDILWPETEGDKAHNSFKTTLSRLRQLIDIQDAILIHEGQITLNPELCWVDLWEFERLLDHAEDAARLGYREKSFRYIERSVGMYQGNFLSGDIAEPWIFFIRDRSRDRLFRNLIKLGTYLEDKNQFEKALDCYIKGVEIYELAEEFYQKLIKCYHRLGRNDEALNVYDGLKRILAATIKRSPSSKTECIVKTLLIQ
jgi:DNA-binding SARP family transcriptional activator